jgi:hypothetical protein
MNANLLHLRKQLLPLCMLRKIHHIKHFSTVLLGLWGLIFWNNFNNKHVHLTENGHLKVHAHPMQGNDKDHEHTEEEYIFWDLISNAHFHTFTTEIQLPENISLPHMASVSVFIEFLLKSTDKSPSSLRGPPSFLI